jgi:K+-transporting ATPase c subunit
VVPESPELSSTFFSSGSGLFPSVKIISARIELQASRKAEATSIPEHKLRRMIIVLASLFIRI